MSERHPVWIGPAGWSYPDWRGVFYPQRRPPGFSELGFLSRFFPIAEINSTFYALPSASMVAGWLKAVSGRSDFFFSAKLLQAFTHGNGGADDPLLAEFRERLMPLKASGRLKALLIQFPWSFKRSEPSLEKLQRLLEALSDFPCAVEFRHGSWQVEETYQLLAARRAAFVNIDQPQIGHSVAPSAAVTAPFAYVRLHGRNAADWFREGAGRDARYNYLYTPEELRSWSLSISEMAEKVPVIVIFNNHFRGQAVVNALQLTQMMNDRKVSVPSSLRQAYPFLESISAADGRTESLF